MTYLERLVATRCAWVPLCCASVRAHFHTLTTGSALNSAQAAKANAATSANPDGRISRAGNLIGAGVAADDASDSSLADQESNKSLLESDEDMSSEHSQSSEDRLQLLPARGRGKGGGASTRVARWRNLHFQHFRQHFQT